MSRRKQEHPQPRKRLLNAESELLHDTLTCGSCQKVFVLQEIVKFIHHKVHSCNKENNFLVRDGGPFDDSDDKDDTPPGSHLPIIGHTRTPISAPICNRKGLHHQHLHLHRNRNRSEKPLLSILGQEKPDHRPGTPPLSLTVEKFRDRDDIFGRTKSEDKRNNSGLKDEVVVKLERDSGVRTSPKLMSDAETNTIISEPSTYTCSTCKQTFQSAWTLVQHAQHMHGMKIYLVPSYTGRNSTPVNALPPPLPSPHPASLIHHGSGHGLSLPLPPVLPPSSVMNGPTSAHSHHVLPQQSMALENHPALQLLRMPMGDRQFPPAPLNASNLFARPSSQEFRMDLLSGSANSNGDSQFHRMNHHHTGPLPPLGLGNFDPHHHHHHHHPSNPFTERAPLGLDSRTRPLNLGFEPQMDFYSQRLRQLAGATSPTMAPSPRKMTPPFSHPPMSSSSQPSTPTSTPQPPLNLHPGRSLTPSSSQHHNQVQGSSASSTSSKGGPDLIDDSNKLLKTWSCEFCNKSFRFQSNLIVHRRCHTGERPYKCPICRHSCSQASKLKRHMKTHQNNGKSTPGLENNSANNSNMDSPRSTPDSTSESKKGRPSRNLPEDDDGSDGQTADNEEEEEELDDDDDDLEEEEELDDDEDLDDSNEVLMAEDLSTKGGHVSSTPTSRASPADQAKQDKSNNNDICKANNGNGESTSNDNSETTSPGKDRESSLPRHSLISEVMDKIGLSHIQQYHDAYQKALEESGVKLSLKNERPQSSGVESNASTGHSIIENGPEKLKKEEGNHHTNFNNHLGFGNNKSLVPHNLDFGHSLYGAFDHPHSNPHHSHFESNKRLKLDIGEHLRNAADRAESLYAGLWLPSVQAAHRDLFAEHNSADHPRLNKSSSESALKSITPSGCRSLSPRPGTSGGPAMPCLLSNNNNGKVSNKEQRRNDTCEYCGKVFKNCSNLTVHRRSHTGEKPYKCELCSYACAQSSKLTRHMKTHGRLGKDVYRCRFCDMPFSVPSTLEKHMRKCVVNQNVSGVGYVDRDSDSKDLS